MGKIIEAEDKRNNRLSHNKRNGLCEMAVDKQYDGNTKKKKKKKTRIMKNVQRITLASIFWQMMC